MLNVIMPGQNNVNVPGFKDPVPVNVTVPVCKITSFVICKLLPLPTIKPPDIEVEAGEDIVQIPENII